MKTLLTLLITACAMSTFAQQLTVPKNREFEMKSTTKSVGPNNIDEEYIYAFKSLGKNSAGNIVFECKLVKALIRDKNSPGGTLLNTDSVRKTQLNSTAVLMPLAMLNEPITVIISPKGKVLNISDRSAILRKRMGEWKVENEYIEQAIGNAGAGLEMRLQRLFMQLPDQKVNLASEWKIKNSDGPFKVTGAKGNNMTVSSSTRQEDGSMSNSKHIFNTQTGLLESAMSTTKGPNVDYTETQKRGTRINRPNPDSAWVNMAVKMSFWSEALKKGSVYDSLKVHQLVSDIRNERFSKDPYFLLNRLAASQRLDGQNSHLLYYKLLVDIPNEVIKDNASHLHNKLGTALSERGADDAYAVSKYAVKTSSFDDWVQHSFAQGFLEYSNDEAEKARRVKHYELAELFHNTKDSLYQRKTNPLYLWVNAKKIKKTCRC